VHGTNTIIRVRVLNLSLNKNKSFRYTALTNLQW